jgi:hypothetical protein
MPPGKTNKNSLFYFKIKLFKGREMLNVLFKKQIHCDMAQKCVGTECATLPLINLINLKMHKIFKERRGPQVAVLICTIRGTNLEIFSREKLFNEVNY